MNEAFYYPLYFYSFTGTTEEKDISEISSTRDTGGGYVPSGIDTGESLLLSTEWIDYVEEPMKYQHSCPTLAPWVGGLVLVWVVCL